MFKEFIMNQTKKRCKEKIMYWYDHSGLKETLKSNCKDGRIYCIFGEPHRLKIINSSDDFVKLEKNKIILGTSNNDQTYNRNLLLEYFYKLLYEKIYLIKDECENIVNQKADTYSVEKLTWSLGRINLENKHIEINYKHVFFDHVLLKSIIIHELTHLIIKDHNDEFYKLVKYFTKMDEWVYQSYFSEGKPDSRSIDYIKYRSQEYLINGEILSCEKYCKIKKIKKEIF
jgi:predicted metal-dependent hydrolase